MISEVRDRMNELMPTYRGLNGIFLVFCLRIFLFFPPRRKPRGKNRNIRKQKTRNIPFKPRIEALIYILIRYKFLQHFFHCNLCKIEDLSDYPIIVIAPFSIAVLITFRPLILTHLTTLYECNHTRSL